MGLQGVGQDWETELGWTEEGWHMRGGFECVKTPKGAWGGKGPIQVTQMQMGWFVTVKAVFYDVDLE